MAPEWHCEEEEETLQWPSEETFQSVEEEEDDVMEGFRKSLSEKPGVSTLEKFVFQVLIRNEKKHPQSVLWNIQRNEVRRIVNKLTDRQFNGFAMRSFNYSWWKFFKSFMLDIVEDNHASDMYLECITADSWAYSNKYLDIIKNVRDLDEFRKEERKLQEAFFEMMIEMIKLMVCMEHMKRNRD